MKYNVVQIGDIHWGTLKPKETEMALLYFIKFLLLKKDIDVVIIAGDYFDHKIPLYSETGIRAVNWFNLLYDTVVNQLNAKLRVVYGTNYHDAGQLEAFRQLADGDKCCIFDTTTVELDIMPGLNIIFCPDECMTTEDYYDIYYPVYSCGYPIHIGSFHGNFDILLPDMVTSMAKDMEKPNVMYEYNFWKSMIQGPLLANHFHDSSNNGELYCVGSYDRWKFGEDNPKGFAFIQYDTDKNTYYYKHIDNPHADYYKTYHLDTLIIKSLDDINTLISAVHNDLEKDETIHIRIKININSSGEMINKYIETLKTEFASNRRVAFTVINNLKEKEKRAEIKKHEDFKSQFDYIHNDKHEADPAVIIQRFIREKNGVEVPLELITEYVNSVIDNTK